MIKWVDIGPYQATCTIYGHKLMIYQEKEQNEPIYRTLHCEGYISHQKIYAVSMAHTKLLAIRILTRALVDAIAHDSQFLKILIQED